MVLPSRRTAALLALGSLLAACATAPGGDPAAVDPTGPPAMPGVVERPSTTVRVGLGRDPLSIDPRHLADDEGEFVVRAIFDGLVDLAPDGTVVPAAAAGWEVEADGLTYRFRLRPSTFHDGEEVTAQHHADALLAVFDPDRPPVLRDDLLRTLRGANVATSERGPDGTMVVVRGRPDDVLSAGGIEVIAALELVVRLERPDPLLLHQLADPALVPLPRVAAVDPERFALEPIGNGPFRMLGPREPGAFIRLAADAGHPRAPRVDGLVLQVYGSDVDRMQRWEDLLAGRLQITAIPHDRRGEARQRFGTPAAGRRGSGLHESEVASLYAYGFAIDVPPFDDVRLRRAISAAIDRFALAAEVAAAGVEPASAILPPSLGGEPVGACPHCVHDPDLARELFAEWMQERPEGADSPPIVLTYPRGPGHVAVAEHIASDLEVVLGVAVRLQARDLVSLVRGVSAGESPFFRYGIRASLGGDAAVSSMLDPAFRPGARENWVRWSVPETDGALDLLRGTRDLAVARSIEASILDQAAVVPLLWTRHDLVVHPDVAGFQLDPTGRWWPELIVLR